MATRLTSRKLWLVKYSASSRKRSTSFVVYKRYFLHNHHAYIWENVLEGKLRVSFDSLSFDLILSVYPPCQHVLLLEKFLFLLEKLSETKIILLSGFFLEALRLSECDRLLAVILEPGVKLVV